MRRLVLINRIFVVYQGKCVTRCVWLSWDQCHQSVGKSTICRIRHCTRL